MNKSDSNTTSVQASQDDTQAEFSNTSKEQSQTRGGIITKFPGGYGVNVAVHSMFNNLNGTESNYSEDEKERKGFKQFSEAYSRVYTDLLYASCKDQADKWTEGDDSDAAQIQAETRLHKDRILHIAKLAKDLGVPELDTAKKSYEAQVKETKNHFPLDLRSKFSPSRMMTAATRAVSSSFGSTNE